jgi:hypothetical protein
MPRPARVLTALAATALATVTLAACDKPVPGVTFLAGSTTVVSHPSQYCFDPTTHCHSSGSIPKITAKANSTVLVDVPRDVADQHWIVLAFKTDSAGTSTALDGYGSTGVLHNRHSVRVPVPNAEGSYYLKVAELRGAAQSGTWIVLVDVSE